MNKDACNGLTHPQTDMTAIVNIKKTLFARCFICISASKTLVDSLFQLVDFLYYTTYYITIIFLLFWPNGSVSQHDIAVSDDQSDKG